MKRIAGWLAMSGAVPTIVFFAIAAHPARLYAETGIAILCTDRGFDECDGKAPDETCSLDGAFALCASASCKQPDGGAFVSALRCQAIPPCVEQSQIDECTGKNVDDPCAINANGAGFCGDRRCPIIDGGEYDGAAMLVCLSAPPADDGGSDAGVTPPVETGCSCDVAGASPRSVLGSIFGLLLTIAALARLRR